MEQIKHNSTEYIDFQLRELTNNEILSDQKPKFMVNFTLSLRSLLSGRKWMIFVLISLMPMLISILSQDYLFGNPTPKDAFLDFYLGIFFLMLFGWGALVISLPLSADDISDHMIDLYVVRPIRRDVFWLSRWLADLIGLFCLNSLIATLYYVFFHLMDTPGDFGPNLDILLKAYAFTFVASLVYGGLYLLVGSLGDRGFTLGVFLAIFEPFFLSLLFLQNSRYIPRNNVLRIADYLFESDFDLNAESGFGGFPSSLTIWFAILYTFFFSGLIMVLGALYYRRREFH